MIVKMSTLYLKLFLLIILTIKCYAISKDYVLDTEIEVQSSHGGEEDDGRVTYNSIDTNNSEIYIDDYDARKTTKDSKFNITSEEIKFYARAEKIQTVHYRRNDKENYAQNEENQTQKINPMSNLTILEYVVTVTAPSTPFNIFQEYEYENLVNEAHESDIIKSDTTLAPEIELLTKIITSEPITKFIDFYSLHPAVDDISIDSLYNDTKKPTSNNWYVPEKYPCWDLPVLYGEYSKKNKTDIFSLYNAKLRNVIDMGRMQKHSFKQATIPPSKRYNKWCSVAPCFGDHTLCLFDAYVYSKVCENEYVVSLPSMSEQIALVNTLNTMRNRIALGDSEEYDTLPPASNMKQVGYDYDLAEMAEVWLRQCLPGPAPCSALDNHYISSLECTRWANRCCNDNSIKNCVPGEECSLQPIIGCIYTWYLTGINKIDAKDIACGHIQGSTYPTIQLLWANTFKIGCAYGRHANGDVRVVCNFAPGASFTLGCFYYCGFIAHKDVTPRVNRNKVTNTSLDLTSWDFLKKLGISIDKHLYKEKGISRHIDTVAKPIQISDIHRLERIFKQGLFRKKLKDRSMLNLMYNRTEGMLVRLVTKYVFDENHHSRCDSNEPIYIAGETGTLCVERGRRFNGLCYDFRDPSPGYRLVAIVAPMALFTVILYDLFSGVVRQTNI